MAHSTLPLVSVIIPCYNHGKYLSEAIQSVQMQTYRHIEIIVVDDGSSDGTREVAACYTEVKYFYQKNQGLSAARNKGIANSTGDLLVFLDADDLLYHDAIAYNVHYLEERPELAFVSGAHQVTTIDKRRLGNKQEIVTSDHYLCFLKSNYIGMHATVMYKRRVFDEFLFDITLKACEDYDMYLRIARKYPVGHHTKMLALYRMHGANMSGNIILMLKTVLDVLRSQKQFLVSKEERKAYEEGVKLYKTYYTTHLFNQLRIDRAKASKEALNLLREYNPNLFLRYRIIHVIGKRMKKSLIKSLLPESSMRLMFKLGLYKKYKPSIGCVKAGDFYRTTPLSKSFGYDRGGPIDRYYIENFLKAEAYYIKGRALEIGDNKYTLQFGKHHVHKSDILHVNESNPDATIIGDLSHAPQIPDNSFDCIILTQTLHLVYDYKAVIQTCYRILKPGGCLLLTVPGITPIDYGEWGSTWLWSFTGRVIEKILAEVFLINNLEIQTYGNVYVASAFLYGMGLSEVKREMLDFNDPQMQVIITAKAVK